MTAFADRYPDMKLIIAHLGSETFVEAIRNAIGEHAAINSTKSQTGHMVGATGSSEIIFTTMMMEKNFMFVWVFIL